MTELYLWSLIILIPFVLLILNLSVKFTVGQENVEKINNQIQKNLGVDGQLRSEKQCRKQKIHHPMEFLSFGPLSFTVYLIYSCLRNIYNDRTPDNDIYFVVFAASFVLLLIYMGVYLFTIKWCKESEYKAIGDEKTNIRLIIGGYVSILMQWISLGVLMVLAGI